MELCDGGDLSGSIEKVKGLGEREAARVFRPLLKALNHIHEQNIIHRDIKPGNILFTKEGDIKLIDFGIAITAYQKNQERTGTALYVAPEVLEKNYGKEVDIWSLGVTLY